MSSPYKEQKVAMAREMYIKIVTSKEFGETIADMVDSTNVNDQVAMNELDNSIRAEMDGAFRFCEEASGRFYHNLFEVQNA